MELSRETSSKYFNTVVLDLLVEARLAPYAGQSLGANADANIGRMQKSAIRVPIAYSLMAAPAAVPEDGIGIDAGYEREVMKPDGDSFNRRRRREKPAQLLV
jgi:hypothetical protein